MSSQQPPQRVLVSGQCTLGTPWGPARAHTPTPHPPIPHHGNCAAKSDDGLLGLGLVLVGGGCALTHAAGAAPAPPQRERPPGSPAPLGARTLPGLTTGTWWRAWSGVAWVAYWALGRMGCGGPGTRRRCKGCLWGCTVQRERGADHTRPSTCQPAHRKAMPPPLPAAFLPVANLVAFAFTIVVNTLSGMGTQYVCLLHCCGWPMAWLRVGLGGGGGGGVLSAFPWGVVPVELRLLGGAGARTRVSCSSCCCVLLTVRSCQRYGGRPFALAR